MAITREGGKISSETIFCFANLPQIKPWVDFEEDREGSAPIFFLRFFLCFEVNHFSSVIVQSLQGYSYVVALEDDVALSTKFFWPPLSEFCGSTPVNVDGHYNSVLICTCIWLACYYLSLPHPAY